MIKTYTITYLDYNRNLFTVDVESYDIGSALNICPVDKFSVISIVLMPHKVPT